jgi:membrane protein YqaA with SNARE-associated domain
LQDFSEWVLLEAFRSVWVPGMREITLPAMVWFNAGSPLHYLPLAMLGAAAGGGVVYTLGRLMAKGFALMRPGGIAALPNKKIARLGRVFGLPVLALYALLPLGHLLLFGAGFLKLPPWLVLLAAALGRGLYYFLRGY